VGVCGNMKYEKQQEQDSQTTSSSLGEKEGAMEELAIATTEQCFCNERLKTHIVPYHIVPFLR